MSTVDDVIEAGAQAMDANYNPDRCPITAAMFEDYSLTAARAQWPVLSAELRELHERAETVHGPDYCGGCSDKAQEWVRWPCATVQELDRIDRELGIGPERAAPCADHRPVQHRDARPPWCNTCGLTESGEAPTGPLDRRRRS